MAWLTIPVFCGSAIALLVGASALSGFDQSAGAVRGGAVGGGVLAVALLLMLFGFGPLILQLRRTRSDGATAGDPLEVLLLVVVAAAMIAVAFWTVSSLVRLGFVS